jgi:hypothetical protein
VLYQRKRVEKEGKKVLSIKPRWVCKKCGMEDFIPEMGSDPKSQDMRELKKKYWRDIYKKYDDIIEQETDEQANKNHEKYMSGEETTTFCKKCAYRWDIKKMKLCDECKEHYHPFNYKRCVYCNNKACSECGKLVIPKDNDEDICFNCIIELYD